ncbi:hypothetical protein [Halomicrobium urmianum]|uniref:hypothetical protein n=1 Tax=Halomicrobium urmianum TaxID=1586233 RepID=UPI003570C4ED
MTAVVTVATVITVAMLPVFVGRLVTDSIFDLVFRFVCVGLVLDHRLLDPGLVVESLVCVSVVATTGTFFGRVSVVG